MATVQDLGKPTPDMILTIVREHGGKMYEADLRKAVAEKFNAGRIAKLRGHELLCLKEPFNRQFVDCVNYLRVWKLLDYTHDLRNYTKTFSVIEQEAKEEQESKRPDVIVIQRTNRKTKGLGRYCPGCLQRLTVFDEKPVKKKYLGKKRQVYVGYFHQKCADKMRHGA